MKKVFAILAIAALASCGGSSTEETKNDSVTAPVETPAPAEGDSTNAGGDSTTAAKPDSTVKPQ